MLENCQAPNLIVSEQAEAAGVENPYSSIWSALLSGTDMLLPEPSAVKAPLAHKEQAQILYGHMGVQGQKSSPVISGRVLGKDVAGT